MVPLLLASSSPRRRELLDAAGYRFDAIAPEVDESLREREVPRDYALRIAQSKALKVVRAGAVTLGADTVVVGDGQAMGKPCDEAHAVAMLEQLSGSPHHVMTGWALAGPGGVLSSGVTLTEVAFRELSKGEIHAYVATGEPMDRAGAYAIQGGAAGFVSKLEGSYSNVVGLPMEAVTTALAQLGVFPQPEGDAAP